MTIHENHRSGHKTTKKSKVPKRLKKKVSRKISKLSHEGKPRDQAIAQGINQTLRESRKKK